MQILVVDDEQLARARLIRLLGDIDGCEVVGEADTGDGALSAINELDPELVFLDVRMPGRDGIAVAKQLARLEDPPAVVFCTAYDEYALDAFNTLAQGYIVKPVEPEQLQGVIEKTKKLTKVQRQQSAQAPDSVSERRKHISAKSRRGVELIPIDSVLGFCADHKYVSVIHEGGETLIDDTLKDLELEFADILVRVHRNTLVRLDKVVALERVASGQFELRLARSEFQPTVSRRHLPKIKASLAELYSLPSNFL